MEYAKKFGIRNGVIMAVIGVLYSVVVWAINEDWFIQFWWLSILLFLGAMGFFIAAQVQTKNAQGGYGSFREVFSAFMIGAIVYLGISTVVGLILFQVVDPDMGPRLTEKMIVAMGERFENMGMDQEQIDQQLARMEEQDNWSVWGQIKSALQGIAFFAIIGAISSLIIRKNKPEWDAVDSAEN